MQSSALLVLDETGVQWLKKNLNWVQFCNLEALGDTIRLIKIIGLTNILTIYGKISKMLIANWIQTVSKLRQLGMAN